MNILDHNKIHDKQIYKYPQLCLVMFSAKSRVGIRDEFAVAAIDWSLQWPPSSLFASKLNTQALLSGGFLTPSVLPRGRVEQRKNDVKRWMLLCGRFLVTQPRLLQLNIKIKMQ